ncbi:histidine kinase [Pseudomonas putida S11]|nr:histidine kinase [Pseudomonas putida S11]
MLKHKDILATWRIDTDNPLGFFDRELVASVIANVITNATRFAAHALADHHRRGRQPAGHLRQR